jgi:hypothetical protein
MQNTDNPTLEDKKIVSLLIDNGEMTAPQICKHFGVKNHQNAVYRLEKLAEKGIVVIEKKKYGTKYRVVDSRLSIPTRLTVSVSVSIVLLSIGFMMLISNLVIPAMFYLLACSLLGTSVILIDTMTYKKKKVQDLLALLD